MYVYIYVCMCVILDVRLVTCLFLLLTLHGISFGGSAVHVCLRAFICAADPCRWPRAQLEASLFRSVRPKLIVFRERHGKHPKLVEPIKLALVMRAVFFTSRIIC